MLLPQGSWGCIYLFLVCFLMFRIDGFHESFFSFTDSSVIYIKILSLPWAFNFYYIYIYIHIYIFQLQNFSFFSLFIFFFGIYIFPLISRMFSVAYWNTFVIDTFRSLSNTSNILLLHWHQSIVFFYELFLLLLLFFICLVILDCCLGILSITL